VELPEVDGRIMVVSYSMIKRLIKIRHYFSILVAEGKLKAELMLTDSQ
jgi:hypothetical protein